MPISTPNDRRATRTRRALLNAFVGLILERRYDEITVAAIIARADVGRSTFYEHFRSKDDLLHESMNWRRAFLAEPPARAGRILAAHRRPGAPHPDRSRRREGR